MVEKKKKKKKEIEEEEEQEDLEEKVEDEIHLEEIDSAELQQFLGDSSAPSLGQVAIASQENTQIMRLEQNIGNGPTNSDQEDFKYIASNEEEGPKYASEKEIEGPARVDATTLGREKPFITDKNVGFVHSGPADINNNSIEKYTLPEKIDTDTLKISSPETEFREVERKKYEPLH